MRKSVGLTILVLVLLVLSFSVAQAQVPAPGGPFQTAFNIQNLSTNPATCMVEFYNSSGDVGMTLNPPPIAPGDVAAFFTGSSDFDSLAAGQYSAVVSCDQEVAAVVNFSDSDSGASHSGLGSAEVGTAWFAPAVYRNYYSYYSNIIAQNATSSPIDVTVSIYEAGNSSPVSVETLNNVPAFSSAVFEQSGNGDLVANKAYSARIEGTGAIAAVVNIYGSGSSGQQLYSYNPFGGGSTESYAPVIMNNYYGYNTALTVQNVDDTETANVKVTYSNGMIETQLIGPGASHVFLNFAGPLPAGNTLYSAKVESTTGSVPIVAMVNESNALNRAASYSGFPSGANTVSAPIVLRSYYGYDSSVTCQNLGSNATDVTFDYAGVTNNTVVANVAPNGTALVVQPLDATLNGVGSNWISSAQITASEPIVCVVNQDIISGSGASKSQDQLQAYNAINATP
jgi:hypothetical protein